MKVGKIKNIEDKWFIEYTDHVIVTGKKGVIGSHTEFSSEKKIPLHPDNIKEIKELGNVFDNINARIQSNPMVKFEVVTIDDIQYGKLIPEDEDLSDWDVTLMDGLENE